MLHNDIIDMISPLGAETSTAFVVMTDPETKQVKMTTECV